jgi:hypothetical protein
MYSDFTKYYVRLYYKHTNHEAWQTLGPFSHKKAVKIMLNYLKEGVCAWVEDDKITKR